MKAYLGTVSKAIVGGLVAAAGAGATAAADDVVTVGEWWTIAAAGLAVAYGVWQTPDTRSAYQPEHSDQV